jgi:hypothetical protein
MKMRKDFFGGGGQDGAHGRIQGLTGFADRSRLAAEYEDAFQHGFFHSGSRSFAAAFGCSSFSAQILGDHVIGGTLVDIAKDLFRAHDLRKEFLYGVVVFHEQNDGVFQFHLCVGENQKFVPLAVPEARVDKFQAQLDVLGASYDGSSAEFYRCSDFFDIFQSRSGLPPEQSMVDRALFKHINPRSGAFAGCRDIAVALVAYWLDSVTQKHPSTRLRIFN